MDNEVITSICTIMICLLPVLYFYNYNGDSLRVERYFYSKNPYAYKALQFCVFFLLLNVAINMRVIIVYYIKQARAKMIIYMVKRGLKVK